MARFLARLASLGNTPRSDTSLLRRKTLRRDNRRHFLRTAPFALPAPATDMLTLHPRRIAHLSLGANVGAPLTALKAALPALAARGLEVLRSSPVYETAPMYVEDQPPFFNMAATVATALTATDLLAAAQAVERAMGRDRGKERRNGPRALDIDIVAMEGVTLDSDALTLPHPRMAERAFVLAPLADIAGTFAPPGWTMTIDEALDRAPGRESIRRVAPPPLDPAGGRALRRDDSYAILLNEFRAPLGCGGEARIDAELRVLHPGRHFRDDISAVMSYEDVVAGLRRLCARAADHDPARLAAQVGDLCLSFPRVLSGRAAVAIGDAVSVDNFERLAS